LVISLFVYVVYGGVLPLSMTSVFFLL